MKIVAPLLFAGVALAKKRKQKPVVDDTDYSKFVGGKYGLPPTSLDLTSPDDFEPAEPEPQGRTETPYPQQYGVNCGTMSAGSMINRIVGGWDVPITEHPWMAYLNMCEAGNTNCGSCGGSIISDLWVLTAAHCTYGAALTADATNTMIAIGSDSIDANDLSAGNLRSIVKIYSHPYYMGRLRGNGKDPDCGKHVPSWHPQFDIKCLGDDVHDDHDTTRNDIGLVKADADMLTDNDKRYPICLPAADFCLEAHTNVMATGWGATEEGGDGSKSLRGVYLPQVSLVNCRFYMGHAQRFPFKKWYKIDQNMTCAGALKMQDSCQGDSGGPLIYRDNGDVTTVYGATSWGTGCGRGGSPGVYARVSSFVSWIQMKSGVFMQDDADNSYNNQCRDYMTNVGFTAPLDAVTSSLVTTQSLIKSHKTFDNYCVTIDGTYGNGASWYYLKLANPNYCDPTDVDNQWTWSSINNVDTISDVDTGNWCWTNNVSGDKSWVKVKMCDGSSSQDWIWDETNGILHAAGDVDMSVRARAGKWLELIRKERVPTVTQFARPDASGVIAPVSHFLEGFCAVKSGNSKFRRNQYVKALANNCLTGGVSHGKWYWDMSTKQVKSWDRKWCWHVNPQAKRRTYVRLVRCKTPRVTLQNDGIMVAKSQAATQFTWTADGFMMPWRNNRIILQMIRNKRIQAVNIWRSGFTYRLGEVIA